MFDNDGKTRYVASAKHEPPPKMNTVVNYGFNDPRAVVVIGIAGIFYCTITCVSLCIFTSEA